jgi:ArsR family transcriptional regulator, arsenate/arsenite/antimonite-responsive transcriptional repressor / arsenate reductase (thioredoxin)
MSAALSDAPAPGTEIVQFCKALADTTRIAILRRLSLTDLRGGEMVDWLGMPHNAISYHLKQLRDLGLLRDRRSSGDARDIYYSLNLHRLERLYGAVGHALRVPGATTHEDHPAMRGTECRVLFLCTHNSARSQLAEGLLRQRTGGRVAVASAGSAPTEIHPRTLALLNAHGIDGSVHYAKPMTQYVDTQFDYVITVCDRAREHCPAFPGEPQALHWSIPDPIAVADEAGCAEAFQAVWQELDQRIGQLVRVV